MPRSSREMASCWARSIRSGRLRCTRQPRGREPLRTAAGGPGRYTLAPHEAPHHGQAAPRSPGADPICAPALPGGRLGAAQDFSSISARAPGTAAGDRLGASGRPRLRFFGRARAPAGNFDVADKVVVAKGERRLYLLRENQVIAEYSVHLGLNPYGPKQREGDFRTPEGSTGWCAAIHAAATSCRSRCPTRATTTCGVPSSRARGRAASS